MERILFISYYWPPGGGVSVQRGMKFVKYLPAFGIEPIVLTVDPDHASYPMRDPSLLLQVPAHIRVLRTRSWEPLRILAKLAGSDAVPHTGFTSKAQGGFLQACMRWVRGNLFIPDARRGWVRHAVRAAAELIETERIGAFVITSPPHSAQLIGHALKKRFPQLRWVADLRDPWTDIYFAGHLHQMPMAKHLNAAWEERTMKTADAVVVVGPSMARSLATRYGDAVERKIHVIPNGYDAEDLVGIPAVRPSGDRFRITYVGTMVGSYEPDIVLKALAAVRAAKPAMPVELRFVGSVTQETRDIAVAEGVDDLCTWSGLLPHREAIAEMAAAHMLLLMIHGGVGEERIITGKIFEYLAVQRPVIGIGPLAGDAAAILAECGAGQMFERSMVTELRDHLLDRIARFSSGDDLRVPGERYTRYERKETAAQLAALIKSGPLPEPATAL